MAERRIARSNSPTKHRWDDEITEIIPINEFGPATSPMIDCGPFATDIDVLTAPELDDLNDLLVELPRLLLPPVLGTRAASSAPRRSIKSERLRCGEASAHPGATSAGPRRSRPTTHRRPSEGAAAVHSRLVISAMAAGAVAAGANAAVGASDAPHEQPILLAGNAGVEGLPSDDPPGFEVVQVVSNFKSAVHQEELNRAAAFAQERAQREARMRRPQFAFPARGILTSGFGQRWGTLHAGLDIANAIGTPIYAASAGEVIASGPTPGFGMWVKIRDAEGTVTLYGHIDTATVQVGERVLAGSQIATMGNRGNSTGPHLHFEVHINGAEKADPMSWLRERGVPSR